FASSYRGRVLARHPLVYKNLAHVLALSAAVLVGMQFWYADQGGVYILWYLPLLLLLVFRLNLSDRCPLPILPETDSAGAGFLPALPPRFGKRGGRSPAFGNPISPCRFGLAATRDLGTIAAGWHRPFPAIPGTEASMLQVHSPAARQPSRPIRFLGVFFSLVIVALLIGGPLCYSNYRQSHIRNFRIVRDGRLYRSGQMSLAGMKQVLRDYNIKTVVTLRDAYTEGETPPDWQEERFCKAEELNYYRIRPERWWASDNSVPAAKGIRRFLQIM